MSGFAVEIAGLSKTYRRRRRTQVAVDGLDLTVPAGCVFGFLGPNGSGKTTTIRCLLGLTRPTRVDGLRLLGRPVPDRLDEVIGRVGSIVETPALFPTMSGRRNLALLGRLHGIGPVRVAVTLERVGLGERADDLVKAYSLGMRQRLGLAGALLKDPELVVLDEPANGLDPAGIREIRFLLHSLADEGRTVLVSSHLLDEVGRTCDQIAILRRGRSVAAGPVGEVLALGAASTIRLRVADLSGAARTLRFTGLTVDEVAGELVVASPSADAAALSEVLGRAGHWVSELRSDGASLEQLFLDLTGDARQEVAA